MIASSTTTRAATRRGPLAGLVLAASLLLGGCATVTHPNPRDPLERINRPIAEFNEGVDAMVLKPVATVYRAQVPPLVRTGVSNFFGNLSDAWSFVNSALQLRAHDAAENFLRFGVNTVFGLGGILDIASDLNIERHRNDFGMTLGRWGVPSGPYLVLPLLGPSTLRDALAIPVDRKGDLVQQIDPSGARLGTQVVRVVDQRANLLRASSVLDEAALDKYSFTRDAYLQRRRAQVFDEGEEPVFERPPAPEGNPVEAP